ncbi:hypothetical protein CTheo_8755 [Ceratobasidium theobromae]|uniref:Uncharacterized protein n=1 Tax=Ceratobasidium theobromae TaxID=1582974 RepID=A0A5N5Q8H7_9AGAM|nr:hypothetical protein CTheo_8755 [Ceratobasidium theobromae]
MSTISNSQPPVPPDEIPPDAGGAKNEDEPSAPAATIVAPGGPERAISSFPPRLVPYKVEASPGLRRSVRQASRKLLGPSPNLTTASDQFIEDTQKEFRKLHKEYKRKKGLQIKVQGSLLALLVLVPRSRNPSRDPSPGPLEAHNTLFSDQRLYAQNIDITNTIPPAEREVSIAPADLTTYTITPPTALPGMDRPTPAPPSPLPVEADDRELAKKVADSMLDIACKDILDRLAAQVVLDPPGDEKLAMPQILEGPWNRLRMAMQRRAACPYTRAGESSLTLVELRLWNELFNQVSGFASEVSLFMESFNSSLHRGANEAPPTVTKPAPPTLFAWSGGDVALAMQAAIFATSREFISWDRALQRTHDFDAAHKDHVTPPEHNALGLFVQPTTTAPVPIRQNIPQAAPAGQVTAQPTKVTVAPTPLSQPPAKTWAKVAAPKAIKPTPAKGVNPSILNTSAIQKELNQIKSQKSAPVSKDAAAQEEEGWNVQGKRKRTKAASSEAAGLPSGVLPVPKASSVTKGKKVNTTDLEVAFKPKSPMDIDLVKARANPNESRRCLMRLLKHCNELTSSKEYKDKTDIRVKSFSYSRNSNCIAVFMPKTSIKEVELFALGLCSLMGLKGAVMVQCM